MRTEDELRLMEFWSENSENIMKIPEDLKGKVTEDDAIRAFVRIDTSTSSSGTRILQESDIFNHAEKLRQKLMNEVELKKSRNNTKFLFDTHIFDKILAKECSINKILESKKDGFEYYITQIQVEELSNCTDADKRTKLALIKTKIAPILIPTESLVVGVSRLSHARLGDADVFNKIVESSQNKVGFNRDALIGETTVKNNYTLVTEDDKLKKRVNEHGGKAISLAGFNFMLDSLN